MPGRAFRTASMGSSRPPRVNGSRHRGRCSFESAFVESPFSRSILINLGQNRTKILTVGRCQILAYIEERPLARKSFDVLLHAAVLAHR